MASQFFLSLILFFFLTSPQPSSSAPDIQQACKATRFPAACESSLTNSPKSSSQAGSLQIITSAINVSSQNLHTAQSMVQSVLKTHGNPNRTHASQNCVNFLQSSDYWTSLTTTKALPHQRIKDGRAWLTAALQYQYDCWSALKYANDTQLVNQTMSYLNTSLIVSTSNALSMLFSYDNYGKETATWAPPKTERDGLWEAAGEGVAGAGLSAGVPTNLKVDVTVCKDGAGGCLKTVQEAVNKAPDNVWSRKFVIHIKAGVYQETVRVPLPKKNVVFLGDGIGKTVITGSLNSGVQGITTFNTATVGVDGEGFMARDITFENKGGPEAHQAVAFRSDSDLSVLENCEFLGNQDTLYSHTLRQFYKSCHIQGNVDFIFGNSAAVFQDCQILIRPRQADPDKGESNTVTAHGRIDPAMTAGYVFQNCSIDGTKEYMQFYNSKPKNHKNYLGRPWKEYSRTVFINSRLGALISPDGWMPWDDDFALKTLYYGEYGNTGPGSNLANRVPWSSRIPAKNVGTYSLNNFV